MFTNQTKTSSVSSMSKWFRRVPWLVLPVMVLAFSIAQAQQLTATLSGTVTDQTEARVPGAKVVVNNEATGDTRETKADAQGFFSVTALIPGTYKVTISAKSFATWEENGILLNQGDSRTIPNIHLKIGSEATAVTVISGADAEIPVDTAEVSATLNNELVDSATLTGSQRVRIDQDDARRHLQQLGRRRLRLQRPGYRHQQRTRRQLLGQRHTALRLNGRHS